MRLFLFTNGTFGWARVTLLPPLPPSSLLSFSHSRHELLRQCYIFSVSYKEQRRKTQTNRAGPFLLILVRGLLLLFRSIAESSSYAPQLLCMREKMLLDSSYERFLLFYFFALGCVCMSVLFRFVVIFECVVFVYYGRVNVNVQALTRGASNA